MALLIDRRSASTVTSKLKEVSLPNAGPAGCPVYELDDDSASSGSSAMYDSDDDVWHDALEKPSVPRAPVRLPEELLDMIMAATQEPWGDLPTLEACSVVCKEWSLPARRRLFGRTLSPHGPNAIRRLRHVLDDHPELCPAVKEFDLGLTAPFDECAGEMFRRMAGVFRQTPCVRSLTMLHIPLKDKVRARFFGALKTLPLEDARFFSSSWPSVGRSTPAPANQAGSDTGALVDLLQHCTTLKTLGLTGYSSQPRILSTALMERAPCPLPTYQLRELNLVSCDLSGPAPLWLLGFSVFSLKTLNIAACTGLTRGVLERLFIIIGHTLKSLHLAIDLEDLADDSSSRSLENSVLLPFTELTDFSCSTDSLFGDEVLSTLVTLPRMERITLCFPSFSSASVLRAFSAVPLVAPPEKGGQGDGPRAKRLKHLTLDAWESHELWDEPQRWAVSQASEAKGVELLLNGASRDEIEQDWYGEDLGVTWRMLERPRRTRRDVA
ncbi:uncharacterized protein JCM10292_002241 [Rhodotorula paludigena]|uniref:uncharacterized protein n=1 Tax=Rhodotorula paludigena TaxID=86838 RepID=UPI0031754D0A